VYLTKEQLNDRSCLIDPSGQEFEIVDTLPLIEWLAIYYKNFGIELAIIGCEWQGSSQFCKGFGGLGAILRYNLDLDLNEFVEDSSDELSEITIEL